MEYPNTVNEFISTVYEDITDIFEVKLEAMDDFKSQLAPFPAARSIGAIKALAKFRGVTVIDTGFPVDMFFSLDEKYSENISGYYPIHNTAEQNGISYTKFKTISTEKNIAVIEKIKSDYIFVIRLSQLIDKRIPEIPTRGCVGFHPTPLAKFRGRAAIVW